MRSGQNIDFVPPWQPIESGSEAHQLANELRREIAPAHSLAGLSLRPIARRVDCDDVLFAVEDGTNRVAEVHLTWRGAQEIPPWPMSIIHDDLAAWSRDADSHRRSF